MNRSIVLSHPGVLRLVIVALDAVGDGASAASTFARAFEVVADVADPGSALDVAVLALCRASRVATLHPC